MSNCTFKHVTYHNDLEVDRFGIIANPFCSLFNHSCDPNVNFIYSKNNEIIVYAKYPIKEGEQVYMKYYMENTSNHNQFFLTLNKIYLQLFRTYFVDFLDQPKDERQALLLEAYQFKCDCTPCQENWSNICLPTLKV